jgi:hypothetical protein
MSISANITDYIYGYYKNESDSDSDVILSQTKIIARMSNEIEMLKKMLIEKDSKMDTMSSKMDTLTELLARFAKDTTNSLFNIELKVQNCGR